MPDLIPLDEDNKHRETFWGSTNPSSVIGTDETLGTKWAVFTEKVHGMTLDMSHLTQGKDYEAGVITSGIRRLKSLLAEDDGGAAKPEADFLKGAMVEELKDRREGQIGPVSMLFTLEEIAEHGLNAAEVLPSNATPDAGIYRSARARKPAALVEAKLRVYADSKMMDRQPNEPLPGLPGGGKPWYGENLTNEVLPKEYDQCQWHLKHYPECDRVYVFITFCMKPDDGKVFIVRRDTDRIRELERAIVLFNHYHIKPGVVPDYADTSEHCKWYLRTREEIYPELAEATLDQIDLAIRLAYNKEAATHYKKEADRLNEQMKKEIGDYPGLKFGDFGSITYKTNKSGARRLGSRGFDQKNAAREYDQSLDETEAS